MKEFWDARYGAKPYAYGEKPNVFFKEQLDELTPGTLLLPAEGEGRNAVYAAGRGWKVTAIDMSEAGRKKALQLARQAGVNFDYLLGDFGELDLPEASFDCIALIYAHFPAEKRRDYHRKVVRLLKPGGTLILEGFSKEQLAYSSGGPRNQEMLFSIEELHADFSGLASTDIKVEKVFLEEGLYHVGEGSVVRLVAQR